MSKSFKTYFDNFTPEHTVYVSFLKKYTLHLQSLFTTPLLGMPYGV